MATYQMNTSVHPNVIYNHKYAYKQLYRHAFPFPDLVVAGIVEHVGIRETGQEEDAMVLQLMHDIAEKG